MPLVALRWGSLAPVAPASAAPAALRGTMATLTVVHHRSESMYVADAIAIFFVEPMIVTLLGGLILREQGWRRYVACAVALSVLCW